MFKVASENMPHHANEWQMERLGPLGLIAENLPVALIFRGPAAGEMTSQIPLALRSLGNLHGGSDLIGPLGHDTVIGGGANDTLVGTQGDDTLDGGAGADTMTGGLGNDTYYVDNVHDVVVEGLGGGVDAIVSSVSYHAPAHVENLTLTGVSNLNAIGNALGNTLTGNAGKNVLNGGAGADTLIGGMGNDTYVVGVTGDQIIEAAGGGIDTVRSLITWTLGDNLENLVLIGSANRHGNGNALDNALTGNAGNNWLRGLAGNDRLIGNDGNDTLDGGAGADSMVGGQGNDTYFVNDSGDATVENAGGGNDTVRSSINFTLGTNVENLILTGTANLNGSGNSGDNQVTGNAKDNILDGGAGSDTLTGGLGDDTFVVDSVGDVVVENVGEGSDTVQASVSYTLAANVENLKLTSTANLVGTGNSGGNQITSNAGNDTLIGGLGNDTYIVNSAGDSIVENSGEGIDTVQASFTFALGANIENLVLAGTANLVGTGNGLDNQITSNAGNDTLIGGFGDDFYILSSAGVVVMESAGGGDDGVLANVSYTLPENVEDLFLGAADNLVGTGNGGDNVISGEYGNDDTLIGGAGNDTLYGSRYGSDTLIAGAGDDSLVGATDGGGSQELFKLEGGGNDSVYGFNWDVYGVGGPHSKTLILSVTDESSTALTLSADSNNDLILHFSSGDQITITGGLIDLVQFDQYIFSDETQTLAQLISAHNSFTLSSGNDNVSFRDLPVGVTVAAGAGDDIINGSLWGGNTLDGGSGHNQLLGGAGSDTFVLSSLSGWDSIASFIPTDHLRFNQAEVPVGNGNTVLDGAVTRGAPGGFATSAELVIFTTDISGAITAVSAAAHIGNATSAYAVGQTALFVVDNGTDSAVYYFKSAGNDAVVSASELTLMASLSGNADTHVPNYVFGA